MSRPSSSAPTAAHAHTPSPPLSTTSATTPNQLSLPRAMLRKLAKRATKNPIEVIVTIFVIVTLAYFQVLHAVTTSNFFEPLHREAAGLAAASSSPLSSDADAINDAARWTERGNFFVRKAGLMDWIAGEEANEAGLEHGAAESEKLKRFLIEPVIVVDSEEQTDIKKALRDTTLANVAKLLQKELGGDGPTHLVQDVPEEVAAYTFARLSTVEQDNEDATFEARRQLIEKAADVDMLATTVNASVTKASALRLLPIFSDDDVGAYGSTGQYSSASTEELRSVRWMAYAMRALVMRFWALVKRADSADIFVMLSAYILMHGTFVNLFLSMRKFGSNFWLGASVLTSSIFAFLCALAMAYLVGVTVDPICLSEALPFLVITVGFEKPFLLTRAVFTHPAIAPQATTSKANPDLLLSALNESQQQQQQQQQQQRQQGPRPDGIKGNGARVADDHSQEEAFVRALTARLRTEPSLRWSAPQPVPANEVVEAAVDLVGVPIIRDYAIEIAVMAVGATSGVSGLREFCQLAALILIFDCAFLFCFFISILTVMVEVHRIKVMRGMRRLKPSTPPNVDSDVPFSELDTPMSTLSSREDSPERAAADGSRQHSSASARPLWRRIVKLILGKVPFERSRHGRENPVARLKLLLITAFLTLHSLNLVSTLTTQSAFSRHQSTGAVSLYKSLVDTAPGVLSTAKPNGAVMDALLRALTMPKDADVIVRVADPIIYVLVDSAPNAAWSRSAIGSAALNASGLGGSNSNAIESPSGSNSSDSFLPTAIKSGTSPGSSSSLAVLDSFMSLWTVIVGDPVISKWMSLALAISIFLNAYLLKGIATGNAAVAEGNAAGAAAFAAARMIGAHLNREGSRLSTADAATDGKPSRRWSEKPAERPNMHDSISEYHLKLAQLSASHAKGKLDQVPRQEEGLSKADVPTKAVAADGVAPDAAASVRDEAKTGEKPSDSLRVKVAGFVGNDGTQEVRPLDDLLELYAGGAGVFLLSDEEVILLAQKGKIQSYALEKLLQDHERAVRIRRALISRASTTKTLESSLVPHSNYDYAQVMGACCENVVGYMPLPVGIAGPLTVDGQVLPIPMATTEGTLVASTSRGCKALNAAGGVTTVLTQDAMTRGPVIEFSSITQAAKAKRWIDSPEGASTIKESFDSTSRFARLSHLRCVMAGRTLYVRFATATGDAMGMNMVSKGVEKALELMSQRFEMQVLSLSGNYCIDKKPSAINWIEGRGKSVCCEAVIPGTTVKSVLKTTVKDLVNLNIKKNLIGSAMAGSVGGFNAHAANIVAAVFLATGQDPAQVVESSMCMTLMEAIPNATTGVDDLLVTVSMPSIEVGTVGGGTILSPQRALLEMLGVAGASKEIPGANAQRLARIIAAAVMAGELSLMGALSAGHLIQAHMKHNRSVPPTPGNVTPNGNGSGGLGSGSLSMSSGLGSMTPLVAPPIASSRASPTSSQMMTMTSRDSSSNASNSNDSTLSAKLSAKDRRSSSVC